MENLTAFITKTKHAVITMVSICILMFLSLYSLAQNNNNPGQNPERPSHAEQASEYLHNIEKDPNGVPNTSVWYAQPWIWAIVAAIIILIIGVLARNSGKRDIEAGSEDGLR